MAIITNKEINSFSEKELNEKIKDLNLEMLKINAQKATQSTSGTKRSKEIRKTIAKIKTKLNEINRRK